VPLNSFFPAVLPAAVHRAIVTHCYMHST